MADLDAEFAAFQAELAAVEQEVQPVVQQPPPQAVAAAAPPTRSSTATTSAAATLSAPPQSNVVAAQAVPSKLPPPPQSVAPPLSQLPPPTLAPPPMMPPPQMIQPVNPYGQVLPMGGMMMQAGMYTGDGMPGMSYTQQPPQQQLAGTSAGGAGGTNNANGHSSKKEKPKGPLRTAGGKRWVDPTLTDWPDNDFRIFVGDLGNDCSDETLTKAFNKYSSFAKAKIVRDSKSKKSKGYGFVSFLDAADMAKALKEMDGKYIGNRPCKLRKSNWDERNAFKGKYDPNYKKQKKH